MSASFASDSVRALALQLDQIERATDLSSLDALLSADKVSPGSLRTQDAAAHAAHAPSALAKLQSVVSSLDLGRGLQKREDLLKALEDLQSACTRGDIAAAGATATATEDDDATKAQESLLWLALARITFAAHGAVIHSLIDDATAMGENIWYWSDVEEDPIGALEYLVQSECPRSPLPRPIFDTKFTLRPRLFAGTLGNLHVFHQLYRSVSQI